ncbi:MAG TPA: GAF domain-containing protein, partial [Pyrinomonadaceae bacterium]|nr:GAF domain-containing protein [Pyrinomonadaceae bacterium]
MESNTQRLVHTFSALADLGQEIANTSDFEQMLRSSFHLLLGSVAIRRGAVAQYDRRKDCLRIISARGLEPKSEEPLAISRDYARDLSTVGTSLLLADATAQASRLMETHPKVFASAEIELLVPLVVHDRLIGVVLLGQKASGENFTEEDLETISALARHIAVGINSHHLLGEVKRKAEENQRLYDGLRKIYRETVQAFAAAIDMKDRYTQGHSVRVGKYSEVIAREMGWADNAVEGITIAGYLHDIGDGYSFNGVVCPTHFTRDNFAVLADTNRMALRVTVLHVDGCG